MSAPAMDVPAGDALAMHESVRQLQHCAERLARQRPVTEQAKSAVQTARALLREAAEAELAMQRQMAATSDEGGA
ncbi:MAG: hypothetical protein ACLFPA_11320 [Dichotomicrobium sp.]